jgi:RimJ/RimL family protein N-acetyltransferase
MDAFAETVLETERLSLAPLRPEDAEEMAKVLADERLHEFIGGKPANREELGERYAALAAGSPKPDEIWRNWVVRRRSDARAVGTVQATIALAGETSTAAIAWVVGGEWQGRGYASEAAQGLVDWLRREGVGEIAANIHPEHGASAAVALRAGLRPTEEQKDGEQVWRASD